MIFLGQLNKITESKYSVSGIHYMPFDSKHGLGKTKEELEQEGILIDSIPEPEILEGKSPIMYVNPITKEVFYEYVDIPKTEEENLKERLLALEKSNAEMMNLIAMMSTPQM